MISVLSCQDSTLSVIIGHTACTAYMTHNNLCLWAHQWAVLLLV